jgi:hypothetical protein
MNCGETNDIAAHGMCYRCYRRWQREKERQQDGQRVDRHATGRHKRETKLLNGFATTMKGLTALGVSDTDRLKIRAMLEPYLAPVKHLLGGPPSAWKSESVDILGSDDALEDTDGEASQQ